MFGGKDFNNIFTLFCTQNKLLIKFNLKKAGT